jgi:RNA polymerase sigma factor (sigma-70 family)
MDELQQFCGSDPSVGFVRLIETYTGHLMAFLRSRFRDKTTDRNNLEDYVQQTWIRVLANREEFCANGKRNFKAWLFTIAFNEVLQGIRKKKPEAFPESFDQSDESSERPDVETARSEQRLSLKDKWSFEVENHDLYRCMQQLKSTDERLYDALMSKYLEEAAEEEVLSKYQIDRPVLYRWRYIASQRIGQCMTGAAS